MKRIWVIFVVVLVFLLVSFANGQDCGKCPFKCKSAEKQQTVRKEKGSEPVVYVNKSDKMYHQEDCKTVKSQKGYTGVVLSKALKAGVKPCAECNPPGKIALSKKVTKKEKQSE